MMRAQLDTSMYLRPQNQATIGEALRLVQGISSLVGKVRQRKASDKSKNDEEFISTVFGKHMAGWNNDLQDYHNRQNAARNEILSQRPDLYRQIAPKITGGSANRNTPQSRTYQLQPLLTDSKGAWAI